MSLFLIVFCVGLLSGILCLIVGHRQKNSHTVEIGLTLTFLNFICILSYVVLVLTDTTFIGF